MREGMRRVVNERRRHAPQHNLRRQTTKWKMTNPDGLDEIPIAGKTGTAETGVASAEGIYSEAHGWFTCFAPFDDPEVVLTIFLERGGEGATYAVPIADKALRAYFELTGQRPRGAMLRNDQQPISDQLPAPDGDPAAPEVSADATPTSE